MNDDELLNSLFEDIDPDEGTPIDEVFDPEGALRRAEGELNEALTAGRRRNKAAKLREIEQRAAKKENKQTAQEDDFFKGDWCAEGMPPWVDED